MSQYSVSRANRSWRFVFQSSLPCSVKPARLPLLKYANNSLPSVIAEGLLPEPLRCLPARSLAWPRPRRRAMQPRWPGRRRHRPVGYRRGVATAFASVLPAEPLLLLHPAEPLLLLGKILERPEGERGRGSGKPEAAAASSFLALQDQGRSLLISDRLVVI